MNIAPVAKPGVLKITVIEQGKQVVKNFELKPRRTGIGKVYAQGVTSADFIYFLMPDRFSNGDPPNDRIAGMKDLTLNRDSVYHRHGGDLQGVINHLDYLQSLGATALWMTPTGMVTAASAQPGYQKSHNEVAYGHNDNRNNNNGFNDNRKERDQQIEKINRDFDQQIWMIRADRYMRPALKNRKIS